MPSPDLFTAAEACAKLGTHVVSRTSLTGVPLGTRGTVHRVEQGADGCSVVVVWHDLTPHGTRWAEDWFSRTLYNDFLSEVP